MTGGVGADDGRRFREAVSLEHRHADGTEETLEFNIKQGAAAYEELHPPAETFADRLEKDLVEKGHERLAPAHRQAAPVVVFLIIGNGIAHREVEEFLHRRALGLDAGLDILFEITCERGHGQHHMRTGLADGRGNILEGGEGVLADGHEGDAAAVIHHCVHTGHMGEAVVQREDDEHYVPLFDGNDRVTLGHVGRVVAMGQHDAFGIGRGTGGIADVGHIVRSD